MAEHNNMYVFNLSPSAEKYEYIQRNILVKAINSSNISSISGHIYTQNKKTHTHK